MTTSESDPDSQSEPHIESLSDPDPETGLRIGALVNAEGESWIVVVDPDGNIVGPQQPKNDQPLGEF